MTSDALTKHLVVPGQIIAVSSENDETDGFLRGHGTYIETIAGDPSSAVSSSSAAAASGISNDQDMEMHDAANDGGGTKRLVASVAGTVERVNKLVSVIPLSSSVYSGQVGDLIIGRISAVGTTRWKVSLTPSSRSGSGAISRDAQLPLSGVDLPGGVQRIRTAEDARGMRRLYAEGDLLSAEVQQVTQSDGTLILHTRSLRYGKLENGCAVQVPPGLIRRMRQHMCTLTDIGVDVLIGCNGGIWIQRAMPKVGDAGAGGVAASAAGGGGNGGSANGNNGAVDEDGAAPLAETLQRIRQRHARREAEHCEGTEQRRMSAAGPLLHHPDTIRTVYDESLKLGLEVGEMMRPDYVLAVTESTRTRSS